MTETNDNLKVLHLVNVENQIKLPILMIFFFPGFDLLMSWIVVFENDILFDHQSCALL